MTPTKTNRRVKSAVFVETNLNLSPQKNVQTFCQNVSNTIKIT